MFQTDQATAATTLPAPAAAGTPGYFTNGNPATGVAATILDADFMNMLMMELSNVVTGAGITLSKTTYTQVRDAIKRIVQNTVVLADTGAVNAYAASNATPLVVGTWVDGVVQAVKIAHTNTGASTYAPDGQTAIPIYGLGLQPLQGGELLLNGTAILMHATIAGVNSGNPICVLMECAGGAQQVPPATQSQHAVQLGQLFGGLKGYTSFTTSGTLVVPANVTKIYVPFATAGGGGGGGSTSVSSGNIMSGAGGGGAGQNAVWAALTVVPGETLTITIGAAGAAGLVGGAGGSGGNTTIVGSASGTLLTLTGGSGGSVALGGNYSVYTAGQAGGAGFPSGAPGQDTGPVGMGAIGGYGASGPGGGGGTGGRGAANANMLPGFSGAGFGSGGGGAGGMYAAGATPPAASTGAVGGAGKGGFVSLAW